MSKQQLHITNGSHLTNVLNELDIQGVKLTWQELLCEGPTTEKVGSELFLETRKSFFTQFYNIDLDLELIKSELDKFNDSENYSEIILWFEYDLFCHINMIAIISLIQQKKMNLPIHLVCSGRIEGSKNLMGLSELSPEQLLNHYKNKVLLNKDDIAACPVAFLMPSGDTSFVDANPQVPLAMTRIPIPNDSVFTTFCTLSSRVNTYWFKYLPRRASA
jgi:hypothetical protein